MIEDKLPERLSSLEYIEPKDVDPPTHRIDKPFAISVIIPTRNESANIAPLLSRLEKASIGFPTEVIFVDDSSDDTPQVIKNLQNRFSLQVTLIARPAEHRKGGLGGAVVEGMRSACAPWVCVMDGDLQHPPELIPQLLKQAETAGADLVVGSRLASGGDASSLGFEHTLISHLFATLTRIAFPERLKNVTDPLSGFFLVRRASVNPDLLRPDGFKILMEILVRCPELCVSEVPFQFGYRHSGESKAPVRETVRFLRLLLRLRLTTDQRFMRFLTVGFSGLLVNNLVLAALTELSGLHYLFSAVLATQVSTLWNFGLTERWVFRQRTTGHSFLPRMMSFLLMNNLMLLLRGPLLTLLVERFGTHYLVANLISLFALTLLRYVVADQWIWRKETPKAALPKTRSQMVRFKRNTIRASNSSSPDELFPFSYDIHGILHLASMFQLPELEYFRVSRLLTDPDIRLRLERRRKNYKNDGGWKANRRTDSSIHYQESPGRLGFQVTISNRSYVEVAVSPLLQSSLHVLYTNVVEPILRWSFVRKGYALVHAACLALDGQAILVTAKTDTGKTSTILRAVENFGWSFLSDDMTIVSRDGKVMSYPKPLTISNHTLSSVHGSASLLRRERLALQLQSRLHPRSGRRIGMKLSGTVLPAATMNAIVQMLIPPPKYMVDRLIHRATYTNSAMLSRAVIIERGPEHEETLRHDQAVEIFIQNVNDAYGFPPYPILASWLSCWNGEDLQPQEESIVNEALSRITAVRLSDPKFNWWKRLPGILTNSILPGGRQFVPTQD